MFRVIRLSLLAVIVGAVVAQPAMAQGGCGTCWEAVDGGARKHAYGVSAPTPPSGYTLDVSDEYFYEITGGGEHIIADQGHTYWLSGACSNAHSICEPVEFAAAISDLAPEALAHWMVDTPGVEVGDVPGTVEAECHGTPVTREVPYASWIMARATQSLAELGFPIAD